MDPASPSGSSAVRALLASMSRASPSHFARQPRALSRPTMFSTSVSRGQLVILTGSGISIVPARMGRAAFLAPRTVICPFRARPPSMMSFAICPLLLPAYTMICGRGGDCAKAKCLRHD